MFALLAAAVFSITMTPATQTIALANTARIIVTVKSATGPVQITWTRGTDTPTGFKSKVQGIVADAIGPSVVQLPNVAQLDGNTQQVVDFTFPKQGIYNFFVTVTQVGGAYQTAKATVNVKRR